MIPASTVNASIKFSVKSGGMDVTESHDNKDFHIYDFEDMPTPANYDACLKTGNFGGLIENFDDSKSVDDILDNTVNDNTT